jgi:hypothetical protein
MFTKLTVDEMVSIVVAADNNSAVYHAINGHYTVTDHMLATVYGFPRPGVVEKRKMPDIRDPETKKLVWDSMTIPELQARLKAKKRPKETS